MSEKYLEYFSLISNLSNTKLVERSDWTIYNIVALTYEWNFAAFILSW